MEPISETPHRKRRRGLILLFIILAVLIAPWILFWATGAWISSGRVPKDLIAPPAIGGGSGWHGPGAAQRTAKAPSTPAPQPEPVAASYEAYLQAKLKKGVNSRGIELFFSVLRQLTAKEMDWDTVRRLVLPSFGTLPIATEQRPVVASFLAEKPGPWLRAHKELLDETVELADRLPLPQPPAQAGETPGWYGYYGNSYYSFLFWIRQCGSLAAGRAAVAVADDRTTEAAHDCLAIFRLTRLIPQTGFIVLYDAEAPGELINLGYRLAAEKFADPAFLAAFRAQRGGLLDEVASQCFAPEAFARAMRAIYLNGRTTLIERLFGRWDDTLFGWPASKDQYDLFYPEFSMGRGRNQFHMMIPRVDKMAYYSALAMRNRSHAADMLRRYDAYMTDWLAIIDAMSADSVQIPKPGLALPDRLVKEGYDPDYEYSNLVYRQLLIASARLNLLRAAMQWIDNPNAAQAVQSVNMAEHLDHPWRDPFGGGCLHADVSSTRTLLWSIGPDLKDDGGRTGSTTVLDIVLELPRSAFESQGTLAGKETSERRGSPKKPTGR